MKNHITMGFAEPADIDEMIKLLEQLFEIEEDFHADYDKQRKGLEMIMNNSSSQLFIIKENGNVIGMCSIQELISTAEGGKSGLIEDLVIDKKYRGMGIGTQFMAFLVNYAKEKGYKRLQLLADRNNTPAINFYSKEKWNSTNLFALINKI